MTNKPSFVTEQQEQRVRELAAAQAAASLETERDWRTEANEPMPTARGELEQIADQHVEWLLETFENAVFDDDDAHDALCEWLLSVLTDALCDAAKLS